MHYIALLFASLALTLSFSASAADLENGKRINRNCALCHGLYGQGTSGRLSPRLAGLPEEYLVKAMEDYRDGKRINPTMMITAGIAQMSDKDIEDVSAFLASIDLSSDPMFAIRAMGIGNAENGEEIHQDECRTCHGSDGYGKPEKGIPPLAGQHTEYLFQSIKMFQWRKRAHDDDPEDDLFDDFSDQELMDLAVYWASLDDEKVASGKPAKLPTMMASASLPRPQRVVERTKAKFENGLQITDISQTVARIRLRPGVSISDAADAMRSKAVELNLKMVGEQQVSREIESRGEKMPHLSIYQFCNPEDAKTMVMSNPLYASYMPCRIAMVEDNDGTPWLMMLNLDILIDSKLLPREVVEMAIRVNQSMLDIMVAGATGEF